jgi:tetratricopeptide (TPR) repeat protein
MAEESSEDTLYEEKLLIQHGVAAWKAGRVREARELLYSACERIGSQGMRVPASVLALYATCLAHEGKLKEAVDTCRHALTLEPHNAEAYLNMARIYLLADARRKAVEALHRGLAISPRHQALLALREEIGHRRPPVISFLPRDNPVNVALGKMRGTGKSPAKVASRGRSR